MGNPHDPISWEPIPKERLFCHDQPNGIILLHDTASLTRYLLSLERSYPNRPLLNPLTRVPFDLSDLWRLEGIARPLGLLDEEGHEHFAAVKRHLDNQALRHKTVALRRFVRSVRNTVKKLIHWTNGNEGHSRDSGSVKTVLESFLESLYAAETSIAKDVVQCIAAELEGWPKEDLAWLHGKAMEFRQTYAHRDVLSSMCMDRRVSPHDFRELLSGIQG
jgi:hypothetical protein